MFRKIKNVILISTIILILFSTNVNAHGGNITGYKDENSTKITEYNGKYYGYHNKNGIRHYHEVEWNEESQKWVIINPAVYYDEKFNILDNDENTENEKISVIYYTSVDGDTAKFKLNDEIITVRFLGIDTPETVHTQKEEQPYGKEASNYTKQKLENANKIELEYDTKALEKDKYNRILAWVWVDDDLLQEELVFNGLARTYMLQNNYKYASQLQIAETDAKYKELGVWSNEIKDDNIDDNITNSGIFVTVIICIFGLIIIIIEKIKNIKNDVNNGIKD